MNPGVILSQISHQMQPHAAQMSIRVCIATCTSVVGSLFFCTFVHFPALFPSQFVLLSIFLITRGDLACFQKAHGQAEDHQGGKAPKQGCANARRATKPELNTTVFCSPLAYRGEIKAMIIQNYKIFFVDSRGLRLRPLASAMQEKPSSPPPWWGKQAKPKPQ